LTLVERIETSLPNGGGIVYEAVVLFAPPTRSKGLKIEADWRDPKGHGSKPPKYVRYRTDLRLSLCHL